MKRFRMAVIAGILSTLTLVSSYAFYASALAKESSMENKYRILMSTRSERKAYKLKLDAFGERWQSIEELSREKGANVSYDISLYPQDFEELNEKIVSTYDHGFFFLKRAVLESTPDGVSLAVTGFKRGGGKP